MQLLKFILLLLTWMFCYQGQAVEKTSYSAQIIAFTPNAGGQGAYSLRMEKNQQEWSLFANTYLLSGGFPLVGASWDYRFYLCKGCFWQFYTQIGGGISSGGPLLEVLWGNIFLWTTRIDFATQVFFTLDRAIVWSYPLWVGISVAI